MTPTVMLKECAWRRDGESLLVMFDPTETVRLADREGHVEQLLTVLAAGPHTTEGLRRELLERSVIGPDDTLDAALGVLDRLGLVESGNGDGLSGDVDPERQAGNLAFFSSFSSLATGRAEFVRRLRTAHVLQLGLGGMGSSTVQSLCGLGIGRFTLLDHDTVAVQNLNRQMLYCHADVGRSKTSRAAAWIRAWDPTIGLSTPTTSSTFSMASTSSPSPSTNRRRSDSR